jgi:hypothetical protein
MLSSGLDTKKWQYKASELPSFHGKAWHSKLENKIVYYTQTDEC